ncbi:MAG: adenosylmethionine decarboxylase [Rubrivivax sp.]|jgi:S-adenosylmethionine decarboxylase proenzyme|nr:adenosylmethionine decarboxylase [Rubrivivax sp.]
MEGLHLTADLSGCEQRAPWMLEPAALRRLCLEAVETSRLTAVAELFHGFAAAPDGSPGGVTGVVLLAESHLAVHTWPESGVVTLDAFVCNHSADNSERAEVLVTALLSAMAPLAVTRQGWRRRAAGVQDGTRTNPDESGRMVNCSGE